MMQAVIDTKKEALILKCLKDIEGFETQPWFRETKERLWKELGDVRAGFADVVAGTIGENKRHIEQGITRRMARSGKVASLDIVSKRRSSGATIPYEGGRLRKRYVSERTKKLKTYAGADAQFILRFLNQGTDIRYVDPSGETGRGSGATWGNRGSVVSMFNLGDQYARFQSVADKYVEMIVERAAKVLG